MYDPYRQRQQSMNSDVVYLGPLPTRATQKFMVFDDSVHEIHTVEVFKIESVGAYNDFSSEPTFDISAIDEWRNTERGRWVFEHAIESPQMCKYFDFMKIDYTLAVAAKFKDIDYMIYILKFT
jgi:hypothetical protein